MDEGFFIDTPITRGGRTGFVEQFRASQEAQYNLDNVDSYNRLVSEAYKARNRDILDATGVDILSEYFDTKPVDGFTQSAAGLTPRDRFEISDAFTPTEGAIAFFENRFNDLMAERPDVSSQLQSQEAMMSAVRSRAAAFETREADLSSRGNFGTAVAGFGGRVVGAMRDPINIASLPFGGGGRTVLGTAVRGGAAGAATEALIQPVVQSNRAELELEAGFRQGLSNVLYAGVGGAAFDGGFAALGRGIDVMSRRQALAREKADAVNDPELEDLIDGQIAGEDAIDASNPFEDTVEGRAAHRGALSAISRDEPIADIDQPVTRDPIRPNLGSLQAFRPDELLVDAKRFQFKSGGDADGVTDRLSDVTKWDPEKAGSLIVWEDLNGQFYVADGHQRSALARRIQAANPDADISLPAYVRREADGITAEDARAIAAGKNLAQGTGTAVDAAKVLRVNPELLDGTISMSSAAARQGQDMMALSDDALGMVINEIVPEHFGAVVGRLAGDQPEIQGQLISLLADVKPDNVFQAESIIRQALAGPVREAVQDSLFGSETVVQALFKEKAKVLDNALRRLRRNKTVFKTLVDEDAKIRAIGENKLDRDANSERIRSDEETQTQIQKLAYRKGPVADALDAAAQGFAGGRSLGSVTDDFIAAIEGQSLGRGRVGRSGVDRADDAPGGPDQAGDADADLTPRDPNTDDMFGDPVGPEVKAQADSLNTELSEFDETLEVPGEMISGDEGVSVSTRTVGDMKAEIEQDASMLDRLRGCVE